MRPLSFNRPAAGDAHIVVHITDWVFKCLWHSLGGVTDPHTARATRFSLYPFPPSHTIPSLSIINRCRITRDLPGDRTPTMSVAFSGSSDHGKRRPR